MRVKHSTLLALQLNNEWQASSAEFERTWKLYRSGLSHGECQSFDDVSVYGTRGLSFQGANLPSTDVQPADEVGLAAVQILLEIYRQEPNTETHLVRSIACLRFMLTKSPSCAGAKFALIRLYRSIGVFFRDQLVPLCHYVDHHLYEKWRTASRLTDTYQVHLTWSRNLSKH